MATTRKKNTYALPIRSTAQIKEDDSKGVFHYEDEEQKKLFDQLNYAYIGGRYRNKKEFPVDLDKIAFWKQETEAFLGLTEEICLERIEGFRAMAKEKQQR